MEVFYHGKYEDDLDSGIRMISVIPTWNATDVDAGHNLLEYKIRRRTFSEFVICFGEWVDSEPLLLDLPHQTDTEGDGNASTQDDSFVLQLDQNGLESPK